MKLFFLSLAIALAVVILTGLFTLGRPIKWIIPGDHVGWIAVQFNNPSCPALDANGIFWVVDVPDKKSACTSTRLPSGIKYFRFEARENGKLRQLKWGDSVWPVTYKEDSGWYLIFVGSKQEFNHSGSMPRPWSH